MKPEWLRKKLPDSGATENVRGLLRRHGLHTVCEGALCPNQGECFGQGTATFLILGKTCTRDCTFCAIPTERHPAPPDPAEPENVARAAVDLSLKHVVITSVTRDDLPDGGASHFARTVEAIKKRDPAMVVEVLIPDLQGSWKNLATIVQSRPEIINHNLETVPRLYPEVRPQAVYHRSLALLKKVKEIAPGTITKSGLMLGLGETPEEVLRVFDDLREVSCDLLTLGQYLQPSGKHHPVVRYIPPEEFAQFGKEGERRGFQAVFSGPFVRSSFHAAEVFEKAKASRIQG